MRFDPVAYLEWAKSDRRVAVNMAQSGLPGLTAEDLDLDSVKIEINGYHPYGWKPLIEAIAGRYGADPESVLPTLGASQAIFLVCAAFLNPGDGVYVEKPAYEPLIDVPRDMGAEVRRFERRFENKFHIDLAEFEEGFAEATKLVLVTNLHNPSGVRLEDGEIQTLAEAAGRRGAMVCIDEVYLELAAAGSPRTSFGSADNIIVVSSLTKAFGLSGLRCGWILAPRKIAPVIRRVVDHLYVEHAFPAEQIALRAFNRLDRLTARNRVWIDKNRDIVREFMAVEPRLAWVEPDGGVVAFPRVAARDGEAEGGDRLARELRETMDTLVVPGGFFENARHFRLGFGLEAGLLRLGLRNIRSKLR